jgi:hypothetical protein
VCTHPPPLCNRQHTMLIYLFFLPRTLSFTLQQTLYHAPVLVFFGTENTLIHSATDNIPCSCTCTCFFFVPRKLSSTLQQTTHCSRVRTQVFFPSENRVSR